jgi:cephalosporin hydroxylase
VKRWIAFIAISASVSAGLAVWITRRYLLDPERTRAAFHVLFHKNGAQTYNHTFFLGVPVQKCPFDLWVMQEMIYELKPDVIVEAGTYKGGSAYYYARLMDLIHHGRVITIDIEDYPGKPTHPRVTFLLGSSTDPKIFDRVRSLIQPGETVTVFLDSDHHKAHVLRELRMYHALVTPGSYLIVEDTHFNGHPILPKFGPGPWEAVEDFLHEHPEFQPDRSREKYGMTFNPRGYLKRVR